MFEWMNKQVYVNMRVNKHVCVHVLIKLDPRGVKEVKEACG